MHPPPPSPAPHHFPSYGLQELLAPRRQFSEGWGREWKEKRLFVETLPSEEGVTEPLDTGQQSSKAAAYVPSRPSPCKPYKPCTLSIAEKTLPHILTACYPYSTTVQGFRTEVRLSVWCVWH